MLHFSAFIREGDDSVESFAGRKTGDEIGSDDTPEPRSWFDGFEGTVRFLVPILHRLAYVTILYSGLLYILNHFWPIKVVTGGLYGGSDTGCAAGPSE